MKNININFIDHSDQRYDTAGDYFERDGKIIVNISRMPYLKYELLLLVHELVELFLCLKHRVSLTAIDQFDMAYTGNDPGACPEAPYHKEHMLALSAEELVACLIGVDWKNYNAYLDGLVWSKKQPEPGTMVWTGTPSSILDRPQTVVDSRQTETGPLYQRLPPGTSPAQLS